MTCGKGGKRRRRGSADESWSQLMEEIQRSPVEVGSLSHYFVGGLRISQVVQDFSHQQ